MQIIVGYTSEYERSNRGLKIIKKKRKNDRKNSKNISRTFSGAVEGIVRSVHFWLVPWSG